MVLDLGNNALATFPTLTNLTFLEDLHLNDNVLSQLSSEVFEHLRRLRLLSVASNKLEGSIDEVLGETWQNSSLRLLNVSYNPKLHLERNWTSFELEVIDVSGTGIVVTPDMCTNGISVFAAHTAAPAEGFPRFVRMCSEPGGADLVDITFNNAAQLQQALSANYVVLLPSDVSGGNGWASHRETLFRIQTTGSRIECHLRQSLRTIPMEDGTFRLLPTLGYHCRCSVDSVEGKDGICGNFWSTWRLSLLVPGSLVAGFTIAAWFFRWVFVQRRYRRLIQAVKQSGQLRWTELKVVETLHEGASGQDGFFRGTFGGEQVVITVLYDSQEGIRDPEFKEEKRILLRHPRILLFYGWGTDHPNNLRFVVHQYMAEGSLRRVLDTDPPLLDWMQKLSIVDQVADGMCFLHDLNKTHNDLKAGAVFLSQEDQSFHAKIGKFGRLASAPASRRPRNTQEDLLLAQYAKTQYGSSPLFQDPGSAVHGDKKAADVYSFGLLMFEVATGKLPFFVETQMEERFSEHYFETFIRTSERAPRLALEGEHCDCPTGYLELITGSINIIHTERPNFHEIKMGMLAVLETEREESRTPERQVRTKRRSSPRWYCILHRRGETPTQPLPVLLHRIQASL